MLAYLRLAGDIYVSVEEIVYVRPADGGGCYIELRHGVGFSDTRTPAEIMVALAVAAF